MSVRVDTGVVSELAKYGGDTVTKCFNCGNCTAVCSLSKEDTVFPRRYIRYTQLGLKGKMLESVDPWLCYYCGDCSDTCPRDAKPGKLMMASRRWLISMYDWTGLSRLMYKREAWELGMLGIVALVVLGLFTLPSNFGFRLLANHPEARQTVALAYFAPKAIVHWGDIVMAVLLAGLLLSNAARMTYYAMRSSHPVPLSAYLIELKQLILHAVTQKRWRDCTTDNTKHWLRHVALVSGYGTMFVLVVVFLYWFQIEDASFHWTSLLGYYATLVLLGSTLWIIRDRLEKKDQIHKDSDLADWLFVGLLLLTSLTGILLHLVRLLDLPMPTYVMYLVHLMIAVPMLVVEVPFGKWAHMLYRPLAIYLSAVQARARQPHVSPVKAAPPLPA
ncbi:MAG TPA: 4Fe-4S dicluster domain-containing protein [Candidatus Methylomirabilis sp.]|nr:4Fe-4S dicluster domain-containing protein [Candidatus Methylomirabilis sp.]